MIALKRIHFKNTTQQKSNTYVWVGIVDKNGKMLKTIPHELESEFIDRLEEDSSVHSDVLIDSWAHSVGIHIKMKRFFKLVSFDLWNEYLRPQKRQYGRLTNQNLYVFSNFYNAFINNEIFFKKSVLWIMGSINTFIDWAPFIDQCKILRCNHDFVEMFGEDSVFPESFDKFIDNHYAHKNSIRPEVSKRYMDSLSNRTLLGSKGRPELETWDNGIKIIKVDEFKNKKKSANAILPQIYDFKYETYSKIIERGTKYTNTNKIIHHKSYLRSNNELGKQSYMEKKNRYMR